MIKVSYIDYGGDDYVPKESIKFLARRFAYLPMQAVNAKFANVEKPDSHLKKSSIDTIKFILERVSNNKVLEANIVGFNDGSIALEVFDSLNQKTLKKKSQSVAENSMSLNQQIIMAGFGKKCDERSEIEVWS